jgi:NH3-dependent NAD+ synthetase
MNKIEEILQSKETYDPEYHTISISDALEAMKEFGKICFKNARKFKKNIRARWI